VHNNTSIDLFAYDIAMIDEEVSILFMNIEHPTPKFGTLPFDIRRSMLDVRRSFGCWRKPAFVGQRRHPLSCL